MQNMNFSINELILFGVVLLLVLFVKKFSEGLFEDWFKKTRKKYMTEEECIKRHEKMEEECNTKRTSCEKFKTDALLKLEPTLQRLIRSDIKNRKILHLIGSKIGIDEKVLASLINGDNDEE